MWTRTLRRTRRAIRATIGRVEASARVIDAAERFAPARPVAATRQFVLVSLWLSQAAGHLCRAARGLEETTNSWMYVAGEATTGPQRIAEATGYWIDAAGQLAEVSNRLHASFERLAGAVRCAALPVQAVLSRSIPDRNGVDAPCFIPGPRAAASAVAGARKISRGRAPPFRSICTL